VLHKKAAFPIARYFRRGFGKQFIKSVILFFGHIRHSFLLKIQQGQKSIPAFHGVEYPYRLPVNITIHDFQHIHTAIKTRQKVFAVELVQNIVIQRHHNGVSNVSPCTAMLKRRLGILDDNRYRLLSTPSPILPQKGGQRKRLAGKWREQKNFTASRLPDLKTLLFFRANDGRLDLWKPN
jgi:hypothetical protein